MSIPAEIAQESVALVAPKNHTTKRKAAFYLLVLYFICEYGRIHSVLGVGALHLPFFVSLGLLLLLMTDKPVLHHGQTKWFLGFLAVMAINIPLAKNNYLAFAATQMMLTYLIIHLALVRYIVSYQMFQKIILVWLLCGCFLCLQGALRRGAIPGSAFFSDNNDFSLAMNMFLGLAYFGFLANPKKNILLGGMIGLFILGILASFSRGGFVGLCVLLPVLLIWSRRKAFGILLALATVFFISAIASPEYWDRMKTITNLDDEKGTIVGRQYMWARAWDMFLEHPWIGVGPRNFPYQVTRYEPPEKLRGKSRGGKVAHSLYFTVLPELGLAGALCFGMILFFNFKTLIKITRQFGKKKRRKSFSEEEGIPKEIVPSTVPVGLQTRRGMYHAALGIFAAFAGFLASAGFLSVLYYPHFWILSAMVTSLGRVQEQLQKKPALKKEGPPGEEERTVGAAE